MILKEKLITISINEFLFDYKYYTSFALFKSSFILFIAASIKLLTLFNAFDCSALRGVFTTTSTALQRFSKRLAVALISSRSPKLFKICVKKKNFYKKF